MKHRITVSVDEITIEKILIKMKSKEFRNKSHLVEHAIEKLLGEK